MYIRSKERMNWMSNFQKTWQQLEASNLTSLSLCLLIFILVIVKLLRAKKVNVPPSPPKLPIIGNLHQLGALPHQSLAALSQKYGPLMLLKLGQTKTLVVSSAKMATQIMKTHDIQFCNRHQTTAANILLYGCQDLAFAPYGEYWRQAKKMCVLELFSAKRVEGFQYVRDEEIDVLIDKIRKGSVIGGESVNLKLLSESLSNNIVSRCVLGEKFEDEYGNSRFGKVSSRLLVLFTEFCVGDFFPALRWVDVLRGYIGELKRISKTMDDFFEMVIEEHKTKMNVDKFDDEMDFVDIMLQLQREDFVDYHFSRDSIKAILLDMFVGGSDTTATSLEWVMTEIMRYPAVMKKVQEEIRTVVGKKPKIEMEDIKKMEYMHCAIKESLRLHPPVTFLVPRESLGDVEIGGYHIPSKTSVFVNVWAIQRDPKNWVRPNEYIPERFMENSIDYRGHDYELIPFGSGRRKCPGISFAVASMEQALANLLYWFDWKLPDGCVLDVEEEHRITVCKKVPLHLKPIPHIW